MLSQVKNATCFTIHHQRGPWLKISNVIALHFVVQAFEIACCLFFFIIAIKCFFFFLNPPGHTMKECHWTAAQMWPDLHVSLTCIQPKVL